MKKTIIFLVFISLIFCFSVTSYAESNISENKDAKLYIDGRLCSYSSTPITSDSSYLVSLQEFCKDLGVVNNSEHIILTNDQKSILIIKDNTHISLAIGSNKAKINGTEVVLNSSPVIHKGKVYIPARFIAESLGKKVLWDKETNSIFIYNYDTINKVKDCLNKAYSNFLLSDKFKVKLETNEIIDDSLKKYTITYEIDKKKKLAYFLMSQIGTNNSVSSTEKFAYNNITFNKKDDKWTYFEGGSNNFDSLNNTAYSQLKINNSQYAGFSINENESTNEILLISDSFFNSLAIWDDDSISSNLEITIDKQTNTYKKMRLQASSTEKNDTVSAEIEFSSNFEVTIPNEVATMISALENDYKEKLQHYDSIIQNEPGNEEAYEGKIKFLLKLNRTDEALNTCEKYLNRNPINTNILMIKGEILKNLNRLEEALVCYDKVIELGPDNYSVYSEKYEVLIQLGRYDEAYECLNTPLDIIKKKLDTIEE